MWSSMACEGDSAYKFNSCMHVGKQIVWVRYTFFFDSYPRRYQFISSFRTSRVSSPAESTWGTAEGTLLPRQTIRLRWVGSPDCWGSPRDSAGFLLTPCTSSPSEVSSLFEQLVQTEKQKLYVVFELSWIRPRSTGRRETLPQGPGLGASSLHPQVDSQTPLFSGLCTA